MNQVRPLTSAGARVSRHRCYVCVFHWNCCPPLARDTWLVLRRQPTFPPINRHRCSIFHEQSSFNTGHFRFVSRKPIRTRRVLTFRSATDGRFENYREIRLGPTSNDARGPRVLRVKLRERIRIKATVFRAEHRGMCIVCRLVWTYLLT